jgi:hypothetical protein
MNGPAVLLHRRSHDKALKEPSVSIQSIIRTVEFKLYLNAEQERPTRGHYAPMPKVFY